MWRILVMIMVSVLLGLALLGSLLALPAADAQADPTLPPTNTPRGESADPSPTLTPTPLPTDSASPSPTATASETASPSATPPPSETASPSATSEAGVIPPNPTVFFPPNSTPEAQVTAIPTAMPRWPVRDRDGSAYDYVNILLLGHDSESLGETDVFRTDTMIIVHINLTTDTVSMLALPRDLYVWIAQWQMQRLNLAWGRGEQVGWTDGGWGLFRQTVLYNFGVELHYYAMVDFSGFKAIIDALDGVTIAVDCPIQGTQWTGEYDEAGNPTFAEVTLPVGVHNLDSREALWYARTRKNSSDFDRGRRQQQLLRAIFDKGRDLGLITQFPSLWEQVTAVVETNIPLTLMVELLPLGLQLEPNQIENHFFRLNLDTVSFTTPDGEGVQIPNPNGAMITLIQNFLSPPTANQIITDAATIHVYDGSGQNAQWDVVAAQRLAWEGLMALPMGAAPETLAETQLVDYSGDNKGSSLKELVRVLNVQEDLVAFEPDPNRAADFVVTLGENYNSCVDRQVREVEAVSSATFTPTPGN